MDLKCGGPATLRVQRDGDGAQEGVCVVVVCGNHLCEGRRSGTPAALTSHPLQGSKKPGTQDPSLGLEGEGTYSWYGWRGQLLRALCMVSFLYIGRGGTAGFGRHSDVVAACWLCVDWCAARAVQLTVPVPGCGGGLNES